MQHKEFNVKEEELKLIRFYQNDLNSAKLLINVTHDKVVTDFSSATSVQIAFLKPDGKRVFQDVQNVNQMQGKYYVVLSTQTLIVYGNVIAQLRFTFPNNKVIETCMFAFIVDESIMSDDAMKSTNEFPVIQKAIEAGKKLEGVDIDGIIAAGAKADAALPKAGGTMTGHLYMETSGTTEKRVAWTSGGTLLWGLSVTDNQLALHDWKSNKRIFGYDGNSLTFVSNTNLLKKTGDTMTGDLQLVNGKAVNLQTNVVGKPYQLTTDSNDRVLLYDAISAKRVFLYDPTNQMFDLQAQNTNLMKKTDYTAKDGRASLTLTANATTPMTGNEPRAIRRGNTVTVIGSIRRNSGSTGNIMTTLPVDMRPVEDTNFVAPATDGTAVQVFIGANSGNVTFNVADKHVLLCHTYVVN